MSKDFIFVSESVTEGHPDKLCDQISDAIVDHYLRQDPAAYIRAECAVSNSILFIAARFASTASVDLSHLARQVIAGVGYTTGEFNARSCSVLSTIQEVESGLRQEIDEAALSDKDIERLTAQQQVTVFGFACDQSPTLMPLPIHLAHKLCRHLTRLRTEHVLPCLMPEGRAQVGVEYKNRRPRRIHSVAVVTSHDDEFAVDPEARKRCQDVSREMIQEAFADEELRPDAKTEIIINPGGPLLFGGPSVHPGLTGRKNGVDTYGGFARHSEKALSGKDPMRIDRTGAYAARYAAKNVVAAGLAAECEVQLSYSKGQARPVSLAVETFGTEKIAVEDIAARVRKHFDFRPAAILRDYDLRRQPLAHPKGFYQLLAAYGHLGRADLGLPWERTDKAAMLG